MKQYLELELEDFQALDNRLKEAESRLAAIVPQIAEQLGRWIQQVTNQAWEQPSG